MQELIPKDLPKGKALVREGINIGQTFQVGRSAFLRHRNVRCESDWKLMQAEKGVIQWNPLIGLSTLEEQIEAMKYLWEWGKSKGIEIDRCLQISNMLNGLPPDLRSNAPKSTSFLMESPEDFARIAQAAPIQPVSDDHTIGSPNSVNNTIDWLKAGCNDVGNLCQHIWDYPYFHDDVAQEIETVKALGIMASKRKDGAIVSGYTGDGLPSQLLDHVSEVGYMLLEKYVVEELCGAAYAASLGGIISHIPSKMATWLAFYDVLKSDHSVLTFMQGNTLEPTEDLVSNYGLVASEFIPFVLLERKYKTGIAYMANPVTECIRVPTVQEICDVYSVCLVALRKALEYEEANMFDDSHINELRAMLVDKGKQFFENTKKRLLQMGVDITDPLQMLLAVRRLGGRKFEEMFHPGERDSSRPRGIVPFVPTDLLKKPMKDLDKYIERIRSVQLGDAVRDKKVILGSTDTHEYGIFVVNGVLSTFGARVIDGGVDLDAEQALDLAFKEGTPYIAISTHNGLCLDWGRRLIQVANQRNQHVKVFMGGRLNAILDGFTEPIDVSERLSDIGIIPCHEIIDLIIGISHP